MTRAGVRRLASATSCWCGPGASVPVDGEVVDGESEVNEAMLTGESPPVPKAAGDPSSAGSINGSGALTVRVTKVGDDTALAGIMRLVADAQASKSRRADPRRPGGRVAVLRGAGRGGAHARRLVAPPSG